MWLRIRKNPFRALLSVIFVFLGWYVFTEARRDVIIIEVISVPKKYEELGFTSAVMTLRVVEQLQQLEQAVESRSTKDRLAQNADIDVPDIEVPETKLSLKTIVQLVQQALHDEPQHVRGEITRPWEQNDYATTDSVIVSYHIYKGSEFLRADEEEFHTQVPEKVVQQYAQGLLKRLNPYLWVVYLRSNRNDRAAAWRECQSIITSTSDSHLLAKAYSFLGLMLADEGKRDEAIEKYRKAIDLDPKLPLVYNNWGLVLADQGKRDEAIEKYRKAIDLDPKLPLAYNSWANMLADQGKRDEAIEKYRKAIDLDPKYAAAYYNWGNVLKEQGKRDEAIEKYRKAKEIDSGIRIPE
ncbi:MAG: tetratricopeptide repeat protein [Acidobacteriaceae bacterium]|nr:tetratricopeptide repeat protein [Acidobacteriaceae bacterium]